MAPIKDETVEVLRDLVHKLEARVQELEAKVGHAGGAPANTPKTAEQIRMILIGPPGAGMSICLALGAFSVSD